MTDEYQHRFFQVTSGADFADRRYNGVWKRNRFRVGPPDTWFDTLTSGPLTLFTAPGNWPFLDESEEPWRKDPDLLLHTAEEEETDDPLF